MPTPTHKLLTDEEVKEIEVNCALSGYVPDTVFKKLLSDRRELLRREKLLVEALEELSKKINGIRVIKVLRVQEYIAHALKQVKGE